jgi:hypothetical protein
MKNDIWNNIDAYFVKLKFLLRDMKLFWMLDCKTVAFFLTLM